MARVVIHLLDPEMKALHRLAEREYRPVRSQAARIIRNELKRLEMIPEQPAGSLAEIRHKKIDREFPRFICRKRNLFMSTKVICIANQKGGVGKTTTAVSLAHGLSQKGGRVLLIDLDPQGQYATALGRGPEPGAFYLLTMSRTPQETTFVQSWVRFSGREGLYLLPGDQQTMAAQAVLNAQDHPISSIRNSISRFFRENLHYIIFDTAPSVGGIQERAVWASDLAIVPTATEFLSADGVSKVLHMMSILQEKKNWRGNLLGILPTFYDEQTRESKATMEDLHERFDAGVLSPIHRGTILRECAAEGQTIFEADPLCRAAKEYQALTYLVMHY